MSKMSQEQINLELFDEVKRLQKENRLLHEALDEMETLSKKEVLSVGQMRDGISTTLSTVRRKIRIVDEVGKLGQE